MTLNIIYKLIQRGDQFGGIVRFRFLQNSEMIYRKFLQKMETVFDRTG